MDISSIQTRDPHHLPPESTLEQAMNLMDVHDIRHLPVVAGGRLVGVVSNRDLLEATGWIRNGVWHASGPGAPRHLSAILRPSPTTLAPDDSVVTAALEMSLRRIGCLPVLDGGRLVGIVTETDLLRAFVAEAEAGHVTGDVDPEVRALMTSNAMTVQVATTLGEAVELCRTTGVRHLPVADGERLVGMLSDRALRKALGERRPGDTHVRVLMAGDPVSTAGHTRLSVAARRMLEHKISALPVIDGERLVGILTLTDLLDHCLGALREPG
ncbi:MAG TPA: CBS domain-containing protein [Planctomycetota bacterium]|nr:CBS domain-containing protein [Planctomycetota bacterium]